MKIIVSILIIRQLIDVDNEVEDLVQHGDEDVDVVDSTIHSCHLQKMTSTAIAKKQVSTVLLKTHRTILCRIKMVRDTVIMKIMSRMALLLRRMVPTAVRVEYRIDQRHDPRFRQPARLQGKTTQ